MKLSRMFLIGFDGCTIRQEHWLREALETSPPAGVLLFDRNIDGKVQNFSSPEQLKELTAELADVATAPLLIAVDQEGDECVDSKSTPAFYGRKPLLNLVGKARRKILCQRRRQWLPSWQGTALI